MNVLTRPKGSRHYSSDGHNKDPKKGDVSCPGHTHVVKGASARTPSLTLSKASIPNHSLPPGPRNSTLITASADAQ